MGTRYVDPMTYGYVAILIGVLGPDSTSGWLVNHIILAVHNMSALGQP